MGVLSDLGISKSGELAKSAYLGNIKNTLRNGKAVFMGIEVPIKIPDVDQNTIELQIEKIENNENFNKIFIEQGLFNCLKLIDQIPSSDKLSSQFQIPFKDPTEPLKNIIVDLLDILDSLGIDDPSAWILEKLPTIIEIKTDVTRAVKLMSSCDNDSFAEILHALDNSLNEEDMIEKLNEVCGFSIETPDIPFPPTFNLPEFDILALGLPNVSLPMFSIPNLDFPSINFSFDMIFKGLIDVLSQFFTIIPEMIKELISSGLDFVKFINNSIRKLFELIIQAITSSILPLLNSLLFAAAIASLISYIAGSLIVSVVGYMIGSGLISFGLAKMLKLL